MAKEDDTPKIEQTMGNMINLAFRPLLNITQHHAWHVARIQYQITYRRHTSVQSATEAFTGAAILG